MQDYAVAARAIVHRHRLEGGGLERFPRGTAPVLRLGREQVLKIFPASGERAFAVERDALARTRGRLPIATPRVDYEGELDGFRYLVMDRLEGEAIDDVRAQLAPRDLEAIAARLGEAVGALHALRVGGGPLMTDWAAFV